MRAFTLNKHFGVPSFSTSDKMSLTTVVGNLKITLSPIGGHFHGEKVLLKCIEIVKQTSVTNSK